MCQAFRVSAIGGKVTIDTDTTVYGLLTLPRLTGPSYDRHAVVSVSIRKKRVDGLMHSNLDPHTGKLRLSAAEVLAVEMALAGGA